MQATEGGRPHLLIANKNAPDQVVLSGATAEIERAAKVLADWKNLVPKFVKVLPKDYARVLQSLKKVQSQGLTGDQAIMAAFEENVRDVARVGGG